ncbi:methylated-DNA--protein-cysteine methyltransferase, inducible [Paenibacillus baekrokdamisoli]|uniref:methylated-DNA--[protein]-cysteine S-methyltransferase n=1 Tax=Paenibacillus baekrokdamisoli TaxID=1712516 RepID=A0A3G9IIM1_9BACL|nr:methylated-DNA--[protein]-cysteine S-methyltransferase [Paenibacillus baekrokdamisoli]MBB3069196.1 methylated-DNA-[protein]-cysteine S-methyltransferase [Paenibacillus baekrokdamisoli]BBH18830.1 methylated-DNA--protein-cysteine methyltransferase, inducible [Paenibacillus baekrokdamisoli]
MENKTNSLYWTLLTHADWNIHIASTSKGLCYVGSHNQPFSELTDWAQARFPDPIWIRDDEKLKPYTEELTEYLQHTREIFTLPFDIHGTPFQEAVWQALCDIPYGQTKSYSDIANLIHKPAAVRAVGTAIGANPILITIPCHRVIGKNGALTGYRGGIDMKTNLLQLERSGSLIAGGSSDA